MRGSRNAGGDDSGPEDETATTLRPRESRSDIQPGSGADGVERKRKSRWVDDDAKPLIQLRGFVNGLSGGLSLDPKICGESGHPTIRCPSKITAKNTEREYQSSLEVHDSLGKPLESGNLASTTTSAVTGNALHNPAWFNVNSLWQSNPPIVNSPTKLGSGSSKHCEDTNLYIANLPPNVDDRLLVRIFRQFGEIVRSRVIKHKGSGLSKGFGFVDYSNGYQASQAIAAMNGCQLEGNVLAVRISKKYSEAAETKPAVGSAFPGADPKSYSSSGRLASQDIFGSSSHANTPMVNSSPKLRLQSGEHCDDTHLYIGHLPQNVDDSELFRMFSQFGDIVNSAVMRYERTGLSKGFGFVKYSNAYQASQAIAAMNGCRLEGKMLRVNLARKISQAAVVSAFPGADPDSYSSYGPPDSHRGLGFGNHRDDTKLYISNLPPNVDDCGLFRIFSQFGDIVDAGVIRAKRTGLSRGFGFVMYSNAYQASQAIAAMNGCQLEGKVLAVRIAGKISQAAEMAPKPASGSAFLGADPNSYSSSRVLASPGGFVSPFPGADPDKYSSQSFGPPSSSGSAFPGADPDTYSSSQSFAPSSLPYMGDVACGSSLRGAKTEPTPLDGTQYQGTTFPNSSDSSLALTSLGAGTETSESFTHPGFSTFSGSQPTYLGGLPPPSSYHMYGRMPPCANVNSGETLKSISCSLPSPSGMP